MDARRSSFEVASSGAGFSITLLDLPPHQLLRGCINLQADANRPVACVIPCIRFSHDVSPSFGCLAGRLRVHVVDAVPPADF